MQSNWPYQIIDLNLDRLEAMLAREHYEDFIKNLSIVRSDASMNEAKIDYTYLLEAQYKLTNNCYLDAINLLTPLSKKYPDNVRIYSILFRALYREHRYDDALALSAPSPDNSYDLADLYLCQAMSHRIKNDISKTKLLCEQAIVTNPNLNEALDFYITQMQTPQDALRAIELSENMVNENPHNVPIRWLRASLFESLQLKEELTSEAQILNHISGNNPRVSELLQRILPS